jgi:ribosome maturation factor RimP
MEGTRVPSFHKIKLRSSLIKETQIRELVEEKIFEMDYFIVSVNVSASNNIRVEIDGDHGVKINDCVEISRHIESNLDREQEDFELVVSSAGMDQPFRILRQYQRYYGRMVEVKVKGGEKIKGKLLSANDEQVELEVSEKKKIEGKKKKELVTEERVIPMDQVNETKVVILFK